MGIYKVCLYISVIYETNLHPYYYIIHTLHNTYRPDLYPPALIEKLLRLQDNVTVRHSIHTVNHTIKTAFGDDWREHIELDPNPIGAGCIAQVFKGKLKKDISGHDTNIPIAIKLIHPHVERLIKTDMALLHMIADCMDKFPTLELLSFGDTCRYVYVCTIQQVTI